MLSLDRREILQCAGLVALSSFFSLPSRAAASTAAAIFMQDAINDIRAKAGMPVGKQSSSPMKLEDFDSGPLVGPAPAPRNNDMRIPPPRSKNLEKWGGICVPVPFGSFDYYYTDGVISWEPNGQNLPEVTVPHGFCTDLASIPQFVWSFGLPRTGKYAYAAILHDFLYWDQTVATREQANEILYIAMLDSGVSTLTRAAIDLAVSKIPYFSQNAWNQNAAAKKAGERRFLAVFPPRDRIVSWAEWSRDPSRFRE
jgi:hypothetical protein